MYFATYQYASFSEAGIITADRKRIVPVSTIGKVLGLKLSEKMIDFIKIADEALIAQIKTAMAENPNMGISLNSIKLLAPIPKPERNIFCIGKNYAEHVQEIKNIPNIGGIPESPIYFSKLSSSVTGPDSTVLSHANATKQIDYEAELAIIIGKQGSDIKKEDAEDYIFGYTVANDITARDLQKKHSQWYKGKSLDTFCPLGPVITYKDALPLPFDLGIRCRVNNEIRQESMTSHMIFDVPSIINDLSQGVTLYPGDIILTGTPSGVGFAQSPPSFLKHGDVVEAEIDQIGTLRNTIE
ncbi:MAG: fumarylacetoacetate hydrolase family protein [Eubacterium sp.]